jgi:hypothetical protein
MMYANSTHIPLRSQTGPMTFDPDDVVMRGVAMRRLPLQESVRVGQMPAFTVCFSGALGDSRVRNQLVCGGIDAGVFLRLELSSICGWRSIVKQRCCFMTAEATKNNQVFDVNS